MCSNLLALKPHRSTALGGHVDLPTLKELPRAHKVHVDQAPFEVGFMSSFMSSSTVKFLFLASSLTFNAVSFLIVREY